MFKYLPHTEKEIKEMLDVIGVKNIDELFNDVPDTLKGHDFDVPFSHSELELISRFKELANKNKVLTPFIGYGAYDHYTPSVIRHLIERQEFLTAYTPYQPEISQGTLQYIFEYQSIIAELTQMHVSNASMYDGATATAEAMFMASANHKKGNKILVSNTINNNIINVLKTYASYRDIELVYINEANGVTNLEELSSLLDSETAGVILQSPNQYGIVEDLSSVKERLSNSKALFILNSDITSYVLFKTPGSLGVDIAVGDCQSLGVPLTYGGPYIGYLATTKKLMRKMPGRICGVTKDTDGKRAFVLTLQAREQHIRREKANSNICSNQSLLALFVTIYTAVMGKSGVYEVQKRSYDNTHYLAEELCKLDGFELAYQQEYFKDVAIKTTKNTIRIKELLEQSNILGPVIMEDGIILFGATEKRTKEEIDKLISLLEVA